MLTLSGGICNVQIHSQRFCGDCAFNGARFVYCLWFWWL